MFVRVVKKKTKTIGTTEILFCGLACMFFPTCKRYQFFLFSARYNNRYHDSSDCGAFEAKQPKEFQTRCFNPYKLQRYDQHPQPFQQPPPQAIFLSLHQIVMKLRITVFTQFYIIKLSSEVYFLV